MKTIPLTNSKQVALVNDADFARFQHIKWMLVCGYACHYFWMKEIKKRKIVRLHRLIMGDPEGKQIDHINGKKLDNRRRNLREVTNAQNQQNRKISKSGYKGMSWNKRDGVYIASIRLNGKLHFLGNFTNRVQAAKAYDRAAIVHFGEFARLNFKRSNYIKSTIK